MADNQTVQTQTNASKNLTAEDVLARKKASKKKGLDLMQKRAITGMVFISPWLIGFILFYVISIFMSVRFSLSDVSVDPAQGGYTLAWCGLDNFIYALTEHGTYKQILVTSLTDMLVDVPLITAFSLLIAIMLNGNFKGRTVVRAIFFLPVILNSEAIVAAMDNASRIMATGLSAVSSEAMESSTSTANVDYYMQIFKALAMPDKVLDYIVSAADRLSDIVSSSGVQIVIFLAALQSISPSLYEVAKIEGATGYETFWKVTLPMVSPLIVTNVVYTVVDSFVISDVVDLSYETIFTNMNYGLGSAMSLISTVIVCGVLALVCYILSKFTFYYN